MKNLRGSILTVLTAMMVAGTTTGASAQTTGTGNAGVAPAPGVSSTGPGGHLGPQAVPQYPVPQATVPQVPGIVNGPTAGNQMPLPTGHTGAIGWQQTGYGAYPPAMQFSPGPVQPASGYQQNSYGPPQPLPGVAGPPMASGHHVASKAYGPGAYGPGAYGPGAYGAYGAGHSGVAGTGCSSCGGYGCDACLGGHAGRGLAGGMVATLADWILPYGEGGPCAPRWYDIYLDGMYLSREDTGRSIDFSSDGINGDILLSTNDLDFSEELGFRMTGAMQAFAGTNLEFTYYGLFDWSDRAQNRPPQFQDDIFSVISDFGIDPFNGFDETDRARRHTLSYSSTIDNFELNVRKRFTAPNCRIQLSWLAGVRYVYLLEDFEFFTLGGDVDNDPSNGFESRGSMDYDVGTRNSLTGFQLGGDMWANIVPGVRIGSDVKAGVYGNYANQGTSIVATSSMPGDTRTFTESVDGDDIAMVADANVTFIYRVNTHWTIRFGYSALFIEGVALASENFNAEPPNILSPAGNFTFPERQAEINDNGNVFYHGGFGGFEWMW